MVPSWAAWTLQAESEFDLFRFSDTPVFEALHQHRAQVEGTH